jgi:hypothetical protein
VEKYLFFSYYSYILFIFFYHSLKSSTDRSVSSFARLLPPSLSKTLTHSETVTINNVVNDDGEELRKESYKNVIKHQRRGNKKDMKHSQNMISNETLIGKKKMNKTTSEGSSIKAIDDIFDGDDKKANINRVKKKVMKKTSTLIDLRREHSKKVIDKIIKESIENTSEVEEDNNINSKGNKVLVVVKRKKKKKKKIKISEKVGKPTESSVLLLGDVENKEISLKDKKKKKS